MNVFHKEEKKVMKLYAADGISESMGGIAIFMLCLTFLLDSSLLLVISVIPAVLIKPLKTKITAPRIGYFTPSESVKRYQIPGMIVLFLLFAGIILLLTVTSFKLSLKLHGGYIIAVLSFLAYFAEYVQYGNKRYLVYTIGILVLCVIAELIGFPVIFAVIACSTTIFAIGIKMLVLFIRNNPIIPNEE